LEKELSPSNNEEEEEEFNDQIFEKNLDDKIMHDKFHTSVISTNEIEFLIDGFETFGRYYHVFYSFLIITVHATSKTHH
jgi:hypothetical protein